MSPYASAVLHPAWNSSGGCANDLFQDVTRALGPDGMFVRSVSARSLGVSRSIWRKNFSNSGTIRARRGSLTR